MMKQLWDCCEKPKSLDISYHARRQTNILSMQLAVPDDRISALDKLFSKGGGRGKGQFPPPELKIVKLSDTNG